MTTLVEQIEKLIAPSIQSMGYELVQVRLMEGNKSRLLQIMAERPDGSMTVDDCANISNQVSAVLDVEDIMPGAYRLEVSSPGIDRPLTKEKDFAEYAGHIAKIETVLPIEGRKRFTGELVGVEAGAVKLTIDNQLVQLPIADIRSAKLLLTDKLIKQHQQKKAS